MHTLVLKRTVYDRDREIPSKIYRLLEDLKGEFYEKVALARNISALPWLDFYIDEINELMGKDPWACGIKPNAKALNKFMEYALRQGLIRRKIELGELSEGKT